MHQLFIILLLMVAPNKRDYDLPGIRHSFHSAVLDDSKIEAYFDLVKEIEPTQDAVIESYKSAGYVMKAKNTWNPIERLNLVFKYLRGIDAAIESSPDNVEIRFLRFSIAYYLPNMLGFKKHMEEDKAHIISNIGQYDTSKVSPGFNNYVITFLEETGFYTSSELLLIREQIGAD